MLALECYRMPPPAVCHAAILSRRRTTCAKRCRAQTTTGAVGATTRAWCPRRPCGSGSRPCTTCGCSVYSRGAQWGGVTDRQGQGAAGWVHEAIFALAVQMTLNLACFTCVPVLYCCAAPAAITTPPAACWLQGPPKEDPVGNRHGQDEPVRAAPWVGSCHLSRKTSHGSTACPAGV